MTVAATQIPSPLRQRLVLEPSSKWRAIDVAEIWRYRDLLWILTLREIQVRYKQTVLGVAWAILQPLLTSGIFAVLFAMLISKDKQPTPHGVPYFVSTFCAMLPWQLFTNSLTQAGNSLVANQRMLTKVYFPRLIIPLSAVLGALADFAVAFAALIVVMICYGIVPSMALLALPVFILLALMAAMAVGIWISALTVVYRDFRYIVPFLLQVGLFVSPVIYTTASMKLNRPMAMLYGLNPMAGVIEGFRWALLGTAHAPGVMMLPSMFMTTVLMIGGAYYFRHMERTFADVV